MSVFTELHTDDIQINGRVNGFQVDWEDISYKKDLGNQNVSDITNTVEKLTLGDENAGVVLKNSPDATTKYDLVFPSGQGVSGSVLKNNGTGVLSWSTIEEKNNVITVVSDTELNGRDSNVIVEAESKSVTLTLPEVTGCKDVFIVVGKLTNNNTVTIIAKPGYSFDGELKKSFILTKKHQKIQLKCLGTAVWYSV